MNVTIVMPLYNHDAKLVSKIDNALREQNYSGKIKVIKVDAGLGLADSLNYGIKKAQTDVVVSLHQDCVPVSKDWLRKLIEPLKEIDVVACVSDVELFFEFWKGFGFFGRLMSAKELGVLTPLMDEKGCAYRKSAFLKTGLFDGKNFRTAGEDFDMYLKLKQVGKIAYPGCRVLHFHEHSFKKRIKKEFQLSDGFGALVRIHGKRMPSWWKGVLKAIPIIGWPLFLINFPYRKMGISSLLWVPVSIFVHFIYCYGFWGGFIIGKQTV